MKRPVLESLFNKVAGLACNVIKKRLQHRSFPVKFAKILRSTILKNIFQRLLLCKQIFDKVILTGYYNLDETDPILYEFFCKNDLKN